MLFKGALSIKEVLQAHNPGQVYSHWKENAVEGKISFEKVRKEEEDGEGEGMIR